MVAVTWLFVRGVGVWGIVIPVAWGFAIVNFVWWIGIGHAGTLISAILLLLKQDWRTSINRFSEAMTLFAVACAGMFPILHLGRPWLAYWLLPYPNTMWLWPQPRSPLIWDVFAVSTYATVSFLFWFTGLIPDFATMRDKARQYAGAENLRHAGDGLAGFGQTLGAISESVSAAGRAFDAAGGFGPFRGELRLRGRASCPGWHTTIFPPYFVAGAIYSGFAMVLTLAIPVRRWYHLEDLITMRHIECMAKVMLGTGLIVAYGYAMEAFMAWYSGNQYERYAFVNPHVGGGYWWTYWLLILCNILIPQLLWSRRVRMNVPRCFVISLVVNVGMWLERFVIVVTSLTRDFVPSSWGMYYPTDLGLGTYAGTIGVFLSLMFLFIRGLPAISIFEMREVVHHMEPTHAHGD